MRSLLRLISGLSSGLASIITATIGLPAIAYAQDQPATNVNLEEIIVTARGREENLQDVSIAISAFDQQAIDRRGITELEDVARFTAGFAFEDFDGGNASPVIRGQATLRQSAREQTVATFLDGVYMPRSWLVDMGTNNLERIEIVKGPQSARYGRNAFSGAINYIPQKANYGDMALTASLNLGSDKLREYGVSVSVPIVEDALAIRAAYDYSEFDGSWENNHPNANAGVSPGTDGNVGGWEKNSASFGLLFNPIDTLQIDFSYYYFENEEEARATNWLSTGFGEGNCGPIQPNGAQNFSLFCGEYPVEADNVTIDPRSFGRQSEADILRFEVTYDISDSLAVSYLFSNVDADSFSANTSETDTINCGAIIGITCNFQGAPIGTVDYDQHQLSLAFNSEGAITGLVGLFYLDGNDVSESVSANVAPLGITPLNINGPSTAGLPFPASVANLRFREEETVTEVTAIFGEITYTFPNDSTSLSVEARYTEEEITTTNLQNSEEFSEKFDFFTPKLTLEHQLDDENLIYASIGRGAKAGGFNVGAVSKPGTVRSDMSIIQSGDADDLSIFDPEFNTTFEIGSKSSLLGGRAILNSAIFYTDWSDLQINSSDPLGSDFTASLTRNLGDATIWGIEIEGSLSATENLSFDAAFSYTKGEYDEGTTDDLYTAGARGFPAPCDGTVCAIDGDIGGNDLERAPDTQISLGVQWEAPIYQDWEYYVRADVGYQSAFYADSINAAESPDRTVANASAGLNIGNVRINLWVRNLNDEKYASNSLAIIQAFSNNLLGAYYGERRTFGLSVKASY